MDDRRIFERVPVFLIMVAALVIAAAVGVYMQERGAVADEGGESIQAELLNHNQSDDKDGCSEDGNAGQGDDTQGADGGCKQHPPQGAYGQICEEDRHQNQRGRGHEKLRGKGHCDD